MFSIFWKGGERRVQLGLREAVEGAAHAGLSEPASLSLHPFPSHPAT